MDSMSVMKPLTGMTPQEHEEWMNEHQKLMQQMMEQMMAEHHMMTGHSTAKAPAAAGKNGADEHQH